MSNHVHTRGAHSHTHPPGLYVGKCRSGSFGRQQSAVNIAFEQSLRQPMQPKPRYSLKQAQKEYEVAKQEYEKVKAEIAALRVKPPKMQSPRPKKAPSPASTTSPELSSSQSSLRSTPEHSAESASPFAHPLTPDLSTQLPAAKQTEELQLLEDNPLASYLVPNPDEEIDRLSVTSEESLVARPSQEEVEQYVSLSEKVFKVGVVMQHHDTRKSPFGVFSALDLEINEDSIRLTDPIAQNIDCDLHHADRMARLNRSDLEVVEIDQHSEESHLRYHKPARGIQKLKEIRASVKAVIQEMPYQFSELPQVQKKVVSALSPGCKAEELTLPVMSAALRTQVQQPVVSPDYQGLNEQERAALRTKAQQMTPEELQQNMEKMNRLLGELEYAAQQGAMIESGHAAFTETMGFVQNLGVDPSRLLGVLDESQNEVNRVVQAHDELDAYHSTLLKQADKVRDAVQAVARTRENGRLTIQESLVPFVRATPLAGRVQRMIEELQ